MTSWEKVDNKAEKDTVEGTKDTDEAAFVAIYITKLYSLQV